MADYNDVTKYYKCWELINRENFLPKDQVKNKDLDKPLPIGDGQTTSQPSLITNMLIMLLGNIEPEILQKNAIKAVDIGSGSGIVTALLACLLKPGDKVLGVEIFKSLVEQSKINISKINPLHLENFANIEIIEKDVYDMFKNPGSTKFDIIYVGAEPKTKHDIDYFKSSVPKLLTKNGIALGPIDGAIQIYSNKNRWIRTRLNTRFIPLFHKSKLELKGGGEILSENEKKELDLIKKENSSRWSINCKETEDICKSIAITSRSANLYKNHLFPDIKSLKNIDKFIYKKCIIDLGSGINTITKTSFISRMSRKNLGIDRVGIDIKPLSYEKNKNKSRKNVKHYSRFVRGNAKTLKYKKLGLHNKCNNKKIVLINNLLYLWIDKPSELMKFYKNIFSWLDKGSQIRIFPVYYGRYDMYNKNLKDYIDNKCHVKLYKPKYTDDSYHQWHLKKSKKVYIKKSIHNDELEINDKLNAKTVVLTIR